MYILYSSHVQRNVGFNCSVFHTVCIFPNSFSSGILCCSVIVAEPRNLIEVSFIQLLCCCGSVLCNPLHNLAICPSTNSLWVIMGGTQGGGSSPPNKEDARASFSIELVDFDQPVKNTVWLVPAVAGDQIQKTLELKGPSLQMFSPQLLSIKCYLNNASPFWGIALFPLWCLRISYTFLNIHNRRL